jgi:hypothetical protein
MTSSIKASSMVGLVLLVVGPPVGMVGTFNQVHAWEQAAGAFGAKRLDRGGHFARVGIGIVLGTVALLAVVGVAMAAEVHQWGRFEVALQAQGLHENPVQDLAAAVEFTGPDGSKHTRVAFWDGGRTWRVRFSPGVVGRWTWTASCEKDKGLDGRKGEFACTPYKGANPLYEHGPIRVSDDRWYFVHADGTPWFWMADTAWNGALMSDLADWQFYLKDRAAKGFTAVQFVTTQWRAAPGDAKGQIAYTGKERIAVNPAFFQRMDRYFDVVVQEGLVSAPVVLWAVGHALDPGTVLPEDQCTVLARYIVARYGAHPVVWILGGDSRYGGANAPKWQAIGRAVYGEKPAWVVTLHMGGQTWCAPDFRGEPWYGFHGYQSGHGDGDGQIRWLLRGPPANDWAAEPHHPIVNLEPNYEGHRGYKNKTLFVDREVRRACYWSLMVTPTAGVSYGCHGIWSWQEKRGEPLNHPGTGEAPPWREALGMPGSTSMKHLKTFFTSLEWWRLRPAQDLLATVQPGDADPKKFVTVARADDGSLAVVYLPVGGTIELKTGALRGPLSAQWYHPAEGKWTNAVPVAAPSAKFTTPTDADWVLWLGPKR